MTISDWQKKVFEGMRAKGFHDDVAPFPARLTAGWRLALIGTEVAEATQEVKRHVPLSQGATLTGDQKLRVAPEMADIVIRVLDFCGVYGIDLESWVARKMEENMARPFKYGTPDAGKAVAGGA